MKVLTPEEMRQVDRDTEELGIPGSILMENAGHRAVEFLVKVFGAPSRHRIVILCGKGNNGGDGYVVARQLHIRLRPQSLHVVAAFPEDRPDARRMLEATGVQVHTEITPEMRSATLIIDALLGTGMTGAARGRALELIQEINTGFPSARVLAIDVPSGMDSASGRSEGEVARADATITFTAPRVCHVLPPNCDRIGYWETGHIGSPASLMSRVKLHLNGPAYFRHLLQPRKPDTNKGTYGHVLVVGGADGKFGAAEMTGLAALRVGAGLVTVASSAERLTAPELMTSALPADAGALAAIATRMNSIAIGPGLGVDAPAPKLVLEALEAVQQPMVLDADALNVMTEWRGRAKDGAFRVLTPHPGEMARLCHGAVADVQGDRLGTARRYAEEHACVLVLKGHGTVIAFPDGRAWINPTGTPAMATGGTGDILTGLIAGLLAQWPNEAEAAVLAGVYLHGVAGLRGARVLGEHSLIATDLLRFLPGAIRECQKISHDL